MMSHKNARFVIPNLLTSNREHAEQTNATYAATHAATHTNEPRVSVPYAPQVLSQVSMYFVVWKKKSVLLKARKKKNARLAHQMQAKRKLLQVRVCRMWFVARLHFAERLGAVDEFVKYNWKKVRVSNTCN